MQHIRTILENVFYSQENRTVTLSFDRIQNQDDKDIYDIMEQIKGVLKSVGVDNINFSPDSLKMTIIAKEDKFDEIEKIAKDFNATIS